MTYWTLSPRELDAAAGDEVAARRSRGAAAHAAARRPAAGREAHRRAPAGVPGAELGQQRDLVGAGVGGADLDRPGERLGRLGLQGHDRRGRRPRDEQPGERDREAAAAARTSPRRGDRRRLRDPAPGRGDEVALESVDEVGHAGPSVWRRRACRPRETRWRTTLADVRSSAAMSS